MPPCGPSPGSPPELPLHIVHSTGPAHAVSACREAGGVLLHHLLAADGAVHLRPLHGAGSPHGARHGRTDPRLARTLGELFPCAVPFAPATTATMATCSAAAVQQYQQPGTQPLNGETSTKASMITMRQSAYAHCSPRRLLGKEGRPGCAACNWCNTQQCRHPFGEACWRQQQWQQQKERPQAQQRERPFGQQQRPQ